MLKKYTFYVLLFVSLFSVNILRAQEYGKIYLDLSKNDEDIVMTEENIVEGIWKLANSYIEDVKEYDNTLEGDNINKDFSNDLKSKYKNYNGFNYDEWASYVRKGVSAYRVYKDVKKKFVDWLMKDETPLVFDDNQYEMGEEEDYIKTDKPLVIKDFKKIVAYSGKEKDILAAKEKYSKDHKLESPSKKITELKRYIIEKNWKGLFNSYFGEIKEALYKTPELNLSEDVNGAKAVILPRYQYADEHGNIQGVILVEVSDKNIFLYNGNTENKPVQLNFDKSENIKNIDVKFVMPQQVETLRGENMLVYTSRFPIYFTAKIEDRSKDVLIKPLLSASVCDQKDCKRVSLNPVLKLEHTEEVEETLYASYVVTASMNVPDDFYKDKYEFGDLVWEKKNDGNLGCLRIDVKTSNNTKFNMFIIGDETKYFSRQRFSFDGKKVVARFNLEDMTFNPLGKEISFWVSLGNAKNYIHKQKVKEMSSFDIDSGVMSWAVLWFAFIGGVLLNLMPCVFPVLFLKLLSYTKLGKLEPQQIRKNFVLNIIGIFVSFGIIALILSGIKWFGHSIGWGMQFQNTYFITTVLWIVIFFLYYVLGLIDFNTINFDNEIRKFEGQKAFEFFSGVFLVLLSTPCMAPYLGTAFGIALSGNIESIVLTVMFVALGLATPYILVAIFPKVAFYFPKPGKWMTKINIFMKMLLLVTIVWLMSILVAQTSVAQIWHWVLYILVMAFILYFWRAIKIEINNIKSKKQATNAYVKLRTIFYIIVLVFVALSFVDVGYAYKKRQKFVEDNYETDLDLSYINNLLKNGNKVLVKVGADWCLTCKYNDFTTFSIEYMKDEFRNNNVFVVDVDWTRYQPQVLRFMQKFGRSGLPFYVLFSKKYPDGVVLPEIVNDYDLISLIEK